jgi:2-dehydro-3-deoxygluconokinase
MVELAAESTTGLYRRGYAGDSFNTAVYLARLGQAVQYLTRLGDDALSDAILVRLREEGIDASLIQQVPGRQPGLYLIDNDESGERHLSYWRDSSPARELFDDPLELGDVQAFYFSGITLAVCRSGLDNLLALLRTLRERGCQVIFDPNYRPRLWRGREQAQLHYRAVLALCDTVLPTLEDEAKLWGTDSVDGCRELYRAFGVKELLIKAPDLTAHGFHAEVATAIKAQAVAATDTTGAGDAFNAGYLAARLTGSDMPAAIEAAQALAAAVVQYRGAIIPRDEMNTAGNR